MEKCDNRGEENDTRNAGEKCGEKIDLFRSPKPPLAEKMLDYIPSFIQRVEFGETGQIPSILFFTQRGNNLIAIIESYLSLKEITQDEREKLAEIFR